MAATRSKPSQRSGTEKCALTYCTLFPYTDPASARSLFPSNVLNLRDLYEGVAYLTEHERSIKGRSFVVVGMG